MIKRSGKILFIGVLLICFMMLFNRSFVEAVTISDITSDSIQEMEGQIDETENLREQLESSLTNVQGLLKELESTKDNSHTQCQTKW